MDTPSSIYRSCRWFASKDIGFPRRCPGHNLQGMSSLEGTLMEHAVGESVNASSAHTRGIVARTRGRSHGPVTRIVSPSDIGELIKPFVFLDYFDFEPTGNALFPMHPHSGIATITVLLSGDLRYEDTTGASGVLAAGSIEWMRAGNGVWHDASPAGPERFHGYQVWIALPGSLENGAPESQYLPSEAVARHRP